MHAPPDQGTAEEVLPVLKNDHVERVFQLRAKICARETDPERYELCVQVRDELLRESSEVQLLAAACDHVMSTHCAKYKDRKLAREKRSTKRTKLDEDCEWDRFLGVAERGLEIKSQCLSPLKTVAACWGEDVVQHYQWVYRGPKYCKVLCTAARNVHPWKRAVKALNWLMLERSQQGPSLKRRPIHDSSNPIQQGDLDNLAKYPPGAEGVTKAPEGFGFDKFGLLVHEKHASVFPQADGPVSLSSSTLPEVGRSDTSESDRMNLGPIAQEVINTVLAEGASEAMASCSQTSSDSSEDRAAILPSPAPSDTANATADSSITSEELDRTDSDTDCAEAEDGLGLANAEPDQSTRVAPRPRPSYQGLAGNRAAKPRQARLPRIQVPDIPTDCCSKVPSSLRLALANPSLFGHEAATQLFPFLGQLCREHLQRYAELRHHTNQPEAIASAKGAGLLEHLITPSESALYADVSTSFRRRRASLSDITTPPKRPRLDTPLTLPKSPSIRGDRPAQDIIADDAYRRRVMAELRQATPVAGSHGEKTNRLVYELLEKVLPPNTDSGRGRIEAYFCTGNEAAHTVESRSPVDAPIFTKDQQPFRWGEGGRPVEQFFRRTCVVDQFVSVQIPSRSSDEESFEVRELSKVREEFLAQKRTSDPLNVLDLQSPITSILPSFLTGENCELLLHVRNRVLMAGSAERVVASTQQWSEWKDVDKWALLSQGGHHTAPHMDSHGYSTWITAQEGIIGFVWMSSPTKQEREAWMANPHCYTGGRWRYVLLRPGETVFFGPGTIHSVFRERDRQTLAFGGHVLQWSGIQRWIQVVLDELNNPATTNEDMKTTAPKLAGVVATLVEAKVKEGRVEELGGEAAVKGFFESVKVRKKYVGMLRGAALTISGIGRIMREG
ncbi:ATP synthase subunit alpha [Cladorrhinum samala]|uniref:ATP synthase subunit alpha n=1 Tax=Cladorrhinum samala TaxID=585594 RepID=A0AAV9HTG5_9PEZI|nr:ATP synthase subunit alpha [Cladorrhinum samala]